MGCTKRTIRRSSPSPPKRAKSAGGVKPGNHAKDGQPGSGSPNFSRGFSIVGGSPGTRVRGSPSKVQQLPLGHGPTALGPQVERDAANQDALAASYEREGLCRAYFQDSPRRCRGIGATVISNFVLNFQDQALTLLALVEEYRQRFPVG
ncbi:hypothetical protein LIER_27844 [Lithospermum erythrorhizon]|uniref:Uncharacterized protein n=1 Tax=Lithospermum erythrorhizon TaxID=34254 RepID=A0AAV3RDJ4_LITER